MKRALSLVCILSFVGCENGSNKDDEREAGPAVQPPADAGSDGETPPQPPPDGSLDAVVPDLDGAPPPVEGAAIDGSPVAVDGSTADSFDYQVSAELASLLARFTSLRAGQPADLDGDGRADTEFTVSSDGSRVWSSDQDGDGTPEFLLTRKAQSSSVLVDKNHDGMSDEEIVVTVTDSTQKRVAEVDEDLDGKPDHRYTWVTDRATLASQTYTVETDATGSGTYTPVNTVTLTTTKHQTGDACEGSDGFPSDGDDYQPFPGSPTIKTGTTLGACSKSDASSIAKAVDCALSKGALCLANTNTRQYNSLMAAAFGEGTMPLDIGCGNSCSGVLASTRGWSAPWFTNSTLNVNPSEWNKLDSAGKCNIMLHEMLHWAGDQGSADHNEKSGAGDDEVYSCGRYCGGCSQAGHGSPKNSAVDCAKCADTPERKERCGVKTDYKTGPCNGELAGLCHAGLACVAGNCETCGQIEKKSCDAKPLDTEVTCCATCPSSCNRSNDLPCNGAPQLMDTCNSQTPPFCPK